jgi:hypothetical protein
MISPQRAPREDNRKKLNTSAAKIVLGRSRAGPVAFRFRLSSLAIDGESNSLTFGYRPANRFYGRQPEPHWGVYRNGTEGKQPDAGST